MSIWYDPEAKRHRSNLVYKIFHVWLWPPTRWVMFRLMPSETAHHFGMFAIGVVGRIDRVWEWMKMWCIFAIFVVARLIAFLPGFRWDVQPYGEEKMTVEEACAKVDAWDETQTFGLHEIARALRAEVARLDAIRVRVAEWHEARSEVIKQAQASAGAPIAPGAINRLSLAEQALVAAMQPAPAPSPADQPHTPAADQASDSGSSGAAE